MRRLTEIRIRDPFILPEVETGYYHLIGTTDLGCPGNLCVGFDRYRSRDLQEWEGPFPIFRPTRDFWATKDFWAPEMHRYSCRYYLFATFKAEKHYRGTQILVADSPEGPFQPIGAGPVTPEDWECLDGTFHVDSTGAPWIVFCHEWVQVHNGGIYAMRMSPDLGRPVERPVFLFRASEAPWVRREEWPNESTRFRFPTYVTDGPFLHRLSDGGLIMLWSSFTREGYALGVARSDSCTVQGPWRQEPAPIWNRDGGHGMIFRSFEGHLMLVLHARNQTPHEHAFLAEVQEREGSVRVAAG